MKSIEKIKDRDELAEILRVYKKTNPKSRIVFTNGCFDILHPGHTAYLEASREHGDLLIVALNSDESVSRIKGPDRPVNTLRDRQMVVAALASVDWVSSFDEDTPHEILRLLKPDRLTKGGDYGPEEIVGAELAREWGADAVVLNLVRDQSTTRVIEKLSSR